MPIYVSDPGGTDFEPAPEGWFAAVCVDVIDQGMVKSTFGGEERSRHMLQIRWQLDGNSEAGIRDDGKPWLVMRRFTASLHEKSALRKTLVSWRGKQFTPAELEKFDVEAVVGAPCMIQVMRHLADNGKVYANVENVASLPKGMPKPVPVDYVRKQAVVEEVEEEEPF